MNTTNTRLQALLLTIPSFAVLLTCNSVDAQVYKWRDSRGIIQYSDKPPVEGFSKATRNEIVNALQKKDLCAVGPVDEKVKSALIAALKNPSSNENTLNFFGINGGFTGPARATGSVGMAGSVGVGSSVVRPVAVASPRAFAMASPRPGAVANSIGSWAVAKPTATTGWRPTGIAGVGGLTTVPMPKPIVVAGIPRPAPTAAPAPTPTPSPSAGANIIQVGLMPAVDINKNVAQAAGFSTMRIRPTSEQANVTDVGAFRVVCSVSHMSNDDPMVFPNQQGATHHHTFYGNTSINYKSSLSNLSATGNSTCFGGTMNRSAYWHPTMINTTTNTPVLPENNQAIFYYKTGYRGVKPSQVKAPPKGLRMLVGNPKATSASEVQSTHYKCLSNGRTSYKSIPNCSVGDAVQMLVDFPQCWDGKNLDSPNHKDHMAYASNGCPASHPVIPEISLNMTYKITSANQATNWRLASDNYAKSSAGGYSGHADWVNGWDEATFAGIVRNCLNASKDCHAHLLGDGRTYY